MALRGVKRVSGTEILDIERLLGKTKNRIMRVGFELEGAWSKFPEGEEYHQDNSVKPYSNNQQKVDFPCVGEIVSAEMPPLGATAWLKRCYPGLSNHTCGLHIHMSFCDVKYYSNLMEKEYLLTLIHYLKLWGEKEGLPGNHNLFKRLKGENDTCTTNFWPEMQAKVAKKDYSKDKVGNRYTIVNYCWKQHKTIEVRCLPMFEDVKQAIRAVKVVLDVTNACIVNLSKRDLKTLSEVYLDPNEEYVSEERVTI